jgi:hypothetical protein
MTRAVQSEGGKAVFSFRTDRRASRALPDPAVDADAKAEASNASYGLTIIFSIKTSIYVRRAANIAGPAILVREKADMDCPDDSLKKAIRGERIAGWSESADDWSARRKRAMIVRACAFELSASLRENRL